MKDDHAAKCLAELGNPTRLGIFRYLVKVGPDGAPVGSIQAALQVPASTLSHHLGRLVGVGLVRQDRESRTLFCKPQFGVLNEIIEFLKSECCTVTPSKAIE
jgi:DNA-binding transcriptional ArsR family regulator